MNERVFKISGKFQQRGEWSDRESDFIGWFVKREETDIIEGYMEEQYNTPYDSIRYIKGIYMEEKKQLTFMKMCTARALQPLAYVFHNWHEEGLWSGFDILNGFFPHGRFEGKATVELEEILDEENKHELARKTLQMYEERADRAYGMKADLLNDVFTLKDFLNEKSPYYLQKPNN